MWRPFAGTFVEHSLDSFIVKHEKSKINSIFTHKTQVDSSPLRLTSDDLERRFDMYKKLQQKVMNQREQIRINDLLYERKLEKQLRFKKKGKLVADDNVIKTAKRRSLSTESGEIGKKGELDEDQKIGLPMLKRKSIQ